MQRRLQRDLGTSIRSVTVDGTAGLLSSREGEPAIAQQMQASSPVLLGRDHHEVKR